MQTLKTKLGRPKSELLDQDDVAYIRQQIKNLNPTGTYSAAEFYKEIHQEASLPKYADHFGGQPPALETIESAFKHAFSRRRPLPEIYWILSEVLFGEGFRDGLPSRAAARQETATAVSESHRQKSTVDSGTKITPTNLPPSVAVGDAPSSAAATEQPPAPGGENTPALLAVDLEVLVAPTLESPATEYRSLAPEVLPVKAGQPLRVQITTSRPAYLYAWWVTPASKVEPLYPWKPGRWDQLEVDLEQALRELELPWNQGGSTLHWTITAERGLETLVVLAREEKMPDKTRAELRRNLVHLPVAKARLAMPPGPHEWRLGGTGLHNSRGLDLKAQPVEDPVRERHAALESRLFGYFDAGKCLSFLNAG